MSDRLKAEASRQKQAWEDRASSPYRDFFVASHHGWDEPADWDRQAESDVSLLFSSLPGDEPRSVGSTAWSNLDVLEIGCGVGRLAPAIAARVRSYSGIDISSKMIEVAKLRSPAPCRFFECDGVSIPPEFADQKFGLIFAMAVFIHCPKSICTALLAEAYRVLAPGGQIRFQFLADPSDPTGLLSAPTVPRTDDITTVRPRAFEDDRVAEDMLRFLRSGSEVGSVYKGHEFRPQELEHLLLTLNFRNISIWRFNPVHLYAAAVK